MSSVCLCLVGVFENAALVCLLLEVQHREDTKTQTTNSLISLRLQAVCVFSNVK